ncbi:MAG: Gfo/Idh/MocA family oxidoreductase [Gemmatimonadota bacterium]|nr:Gfo/Idh/MocA family oxidoreductase [Gemmatimonadota bacterium]
MSDSYPKRPPMHRRDLLKLGAAGLGLGVTGGLTELAGEAPDRLREGPDLGPAPERPFAADPIDVVRIGFVGVGLQGGSHVRNFLRIEGVEIVALGDINEARAEEVAAWVETDGRRRPTLYTRGERDFVRMCEEEELDLVFTATPWEWHVPVCLSAMENGKHAATEVPAAYAVEDCWQLVEHAERFEKHCVMMENCNYDRPEMMVFNMARQGLFGEILHAECGYLHDLRAIKFEDRNEGLWRRAHAMTREGNFYPTHGLGPVANVMDINRGDQLDYLVSMSTPARGLEAWAAEHYPEGHPKRSERYVQGDVNTTMIKTVRGRTIFVSHDTNLPRPYSRIHMVQGTDGLFQGYPNRVHVEGLSEDHRWDDWMQWREEYDHPIWRELEARSAGAGHGGMDFIEDYQLVKALREGKPTDMNVYDAAMLSVICPLTEWSVENRSRPIDVPDFTRGRWAQWPRLEFLGA